MADAAPLPHAFTSENARTMAARSWELRRQRAAQQPAPPPEATQLSQASESPAAYAEQQLRRVRAMLDKIDADLAECDVPIDCERLARAGNVLAERWRILANIPLPGSRRPGKETAPKVRDIEPLG